MKMFILIITAAALSIFSSIAMAEQMQTFKSGSELQMDCAALNAPLKTDTKILLDATCLNYIKGVFDLHQTLVGRKIIEPHLCKPADADLGQMARTIIQYIEANQEKAETTASSLILPALSAAYPCTEFPSSK